MHKGFHAKTLTGVLAAALLTGSVFAAGPTLDQLPTVIISDRMNQAEVEGLATDGTPGNETWVFDQYTDPTRNIFRFTDAFLLSDYVHFGTDSVPDIESTQFLFQEVEDDGMGGFAPVVTNTIAINGTPGAAGTVDYAAIVGSGANVSASNGLDFLNIQYTPDPSNPNLTPLATFTDEALISLYVANAAATGEVDMNMFSVFTTNDATVTPWDTLSQATSIYTPVACYEDFGGWVFSTVSSFPEGLRRAPFVQGAYTIATPARTTTATTTYSITGGTAPTFGLGGVLSNTGVANLQAESDGAPAGSLDSVVVSAPQYQSWGSYRGDFELDSAQPAGLGDIRVPITEGNAYMAQWYITGTATPGNVDNQPGVRFRMGDSAYWGIGQSTDEYLDKTSSSFDNVERAHRTYFYAHGDGDMAFYFDIVDISSNNDGIEWSLDRLEVFSFDPADLTGETLVANEGGTGFSTLAGQTPPAAAPTPFTIEAAFGDGGVWGFENLISRDFDAGVTLGANDYNDTASAADRVATSTGSGASVLSMQLAANPAQQGQTLVSWDTRGYFNANSAPFGPGDANEWLDDVDTDKLYRADFWLSSTAASASLPPGRVFVANFIDNAPVTGGVLGESDGADARYFSFQFDSSTREYTDEGKGWFDAFNSPSTTPGKISVMPFGTSARRITMFFEPQVVANTRGLIDLRLGVDMFAFDSFYNPAFVAGTDNGTWNLHRVAVRSYDLPGAVTGSCP